MSTEPYTPLFEEVQSAYVHGAQGGHEDDQARVEAIREVRRFIAKVKADALREAANALPKPVGLGCNPECHTVDGASLRARADRIEAGEA